jgi:hypothetical protein
VQRQPEILVNRVAHAGTMTAGVVNESLTRRLDAACAP